MGKRHAQVPRREEQIQASQPSFSSLPIPLASVPCDRVPLALRLLPLAFCRFCSTKKVTMAETASFFSIWSMRTIQNMGNLDGPAFCPKSDRFMGGRANLFANKLIQEASATAPIFWLGGHRHFIDANNWQQSVGWPLGGLPLAYFTFRSSQISHHATRSADPPTAP